MLCKELNIPNKLWQDKRIKHEGKIIYGYILAKGLDKLVTHLNVGELQKTISITNKGLNKNLKLLEDCEYLRFKEYSNGLYEITLN